MKLQISTTFDFGKLAKFVESEAFTGQVNRILGSHIAESSKRFIMQGKVTPKLANSTIKRRMRSKVKQNVNTPLFHTGTLANSLKPVKEGIKGAYYGEYHLEGDGVPKRNFIAFEKEKIQKPLNTLMKKFYKALKK